MNVSSDSRPDPPTVTDESKTFEGYGGRKHNVARKRKRITISRKADKSSSEEKRSGALQIGKRIRMQNSAQENHPVNPKEKQEVRQLGDQCLSMLYYQEYSNEYERRVERNLDTVVELLMPLYYSGTKLQEISRLATRMSKTTIKINETKQIILGFNESKREKDDVEDAHQKMRELAEWQGEIKRGNIKDSVDYDELVG